MSDDFLAAMAAGSRRRAGEARVRIPYDALERQARQAAAPPKLRLHARFDLIAEIKLRSPAAGGPARADDDLPTRAAAYAAGGAAAVSVLTEPSRFDGSIHHLQRAARMLEPLSLPAMRKDFIVDPYQLVEARAAGAGGALLILRLLEPAELASLVAVGRSLELFLLLEAFDAADLDAARALIDAVGPEGLLVGVNSRDLTTLQVRPERLLELAPRLPRAVPCVAESGIASADDACAVARAGYRVALVGTALMQSGDPGALVRELVDAGRAA
ncbi:MAG: indole-3-glycerol-phosphate synthase TrpC [Gammaproteobacteria bacterium]|nr:indole-3-glycerol-phosphate synthase TrpC [Gammaproteobacteria bacterium]